MSVFAVYRCLYGADFVEYSIRSLLDAVDKVIVVWGGRAFANADRCIYRGREVMFPERFDDLPERVKAMDDPRIEFVEHYHPTPRNQWTELMNNVVIPKFGKPDAAMFMHVGMVWRADQLLKAFEEFFNNPISYANSGSIETWRGLDYRIPWRMRVGCGFWKFDGLRRMPRTALDSNPERVALANIPQLSGEVHNLRYSQNPNIMFWRQLVVMEYVAAAGDSKPDPDHFEEKWLKWHPVTNNKNLEMSKAFAHYIPEVVPYDTEELPEEIRRDLAALQAATSNDVWKGYPE